MKDPVFFVKIRSGFILLVLFAIFYGKAKGLLKLCSAHAKETETDVNNNGEFLKIVSCSV